MKTTTDTASMIKKEINNLEDDIKQNEQILTWLNKMDDKTVNRGKREKRGLGGGFGVGPPVYSQNRRLPPSQMGAQMGAYLPPIVPQSPVMPGPRQGRYFKGFVGSKKSRLITGILFSSLLFEEP